ncbi:hypothetical protein COJ85_24680 [Bacillus sp. AFS076308]|uniref:hypothetical protein n=1 Tax=unclassified Bacillus (in: firmicutes) TaxID=185979 RepID=UPI000BF4E828|nr:MULTISPECIES: hypothetical protein [unclassified Bacillus (in: firmicutes)]PFN96070.1 hypothetical protein COJ85_24680 [Bacillus sp. AFS076308]PGV45283.1 hypothetical protein COD92_30960 [Bacillus sp. AFS037270]
MENTIETVYRLENPEKNIIKFATGTQLRYEDVIKDVFGVACINDLHMMLQYNKSFQTSICNSYGISEKKITLDKIIRIASKSDMLTLKQHLIYEKSHNDVQDDDAHPAENTNHVNRPFDTIIKLQEGIYQWDDSNYSYNAVTNGA